MNKPRLLVITSCTGKKAKDSPRRLTLLDFRNHERFARRQDELASLACKATDLYTGGQHKAVKRGVSIIRQMYGQDAVTLNIVSAGYGLLAEEDKVVPYEVTFNRMSSDKIESRSLELGLPEAVRTLVDGYSLVLFLLGQQYLQSIRSPVKPRNDQRFIFLSGESWSDQLRKSGATVVRAGKDEAKRYSSSAIALKGKMFELFAKGVVEEGGKAFDFLQNEDTGKAFVRLVNLGLAAQ